MRKFFLIAIAGVAFVCLQDVQPQELSQDFSIDLVDLPDYDTGIYKIQNFALPIEVMSLEEDFNLPKSKQKASKTFSGQRVVYNSCGGLPYRRS